MINYGPWSRGERSALRQARSWQSPVLYGACVTLTHVELLHMDWAPPGLADAIISGPRAHRRGGERSPMGSAFGDECFEVLCSAFGWIIDTPVVGTGRVFIAEARQPRSSIAKRALPSRSTVKVFDLARGADEAEGAIAAGSRWPDWDNRSLAVEVRGELRVARWLAQRSRPLRHFANDPTHTHALERALHDQLLDAEARGVQTFTVATCYVRSSPLRTVDVRACCRVWVSTVGRSSPSLSRTGGLMTKDDPGRPD